MSRGPMTGRCRPWPWLAVLLLAQGLGSGRAQSGGDDLDARLGLADLPAYRAALAGKAATADAHASEAEPVRTVTFHDLWDHPEAWRGHRVQVRGKVARIFRQDAVGSFPPLVEAWLTTPQGDLYCTVFPTAAVPDIGREVTFTGTFLRTIRYAGSDQPRLAPWIVGDRAPASTNPVPDPAAADTLRAIGGGSQSHPEWNLPAQSWSRTGWILGIALGLAGAGVLVWKHARGPLAGRSHGTRTRHEGSIAADPPLVFLESEPVNGSALPDARSH